MAGTKIFWTIEEKQILVVECYQLITTHIGLSLRSALLKAQEKLPESRRRDIPTVSGMTWLTEGLATLHSTTQQPSTLPAPTASEQVAFDAVSQTVVALASPYLVQLTLQVLTNAEVQKAVAELISNRRGAPGALPHAPVAEPSGAKKV